MADEPFRGNLARPNKAMRLAPLAQVISALGSAYRMIQQEESLAI